MTHNWRSFWNDRRNWLKSGLLSLAGLAALHAGMMARLGVDRGIASEKGTALAAGAGWEPVSLWHQMSWGDSLRVGREAGSPVAMYQLGVAAGGGAYKGAERKMVGTSALELIVANPAQALEKIRILAEQLGGYLQSSQLGGNQSSPNASVTIRVPATQLEEARTEIKKLAARIESEDTEARDVTKEYVDMEARLRNLRVEEAQYLSIMKRANTVKDTLEVSGKLSNVRGQIEQQQAEFEALSKQVETVAITVALHSEAEAQVFGLHWRPLYELKLAARDGLDGLASYVAAMVSFVFLLPTILLWLGTILLGAAFGWRILRWAARAFFGFPKPATAAGPGS
jgi:cell division protein FtsL